MVWDYFDPLGEITKLSLVFLLAVSQIQHSFEVFMLQKFRPGKMLTLFTTGVINKTSSGNPADILSKPVYF